MGNWDSKTLRIWSLIFDWIPAGKDSRVHGSAQEDPLENAGSPLIEPESCQDEGQEAGHHGEDEDEVVPEQRFGTLFGYY